MCSLSRLSLDILVACSTLRTCVRTVDGRRFSIGLSLRSTTVCHLCPSENATEEQQSNMPDREDPTRMAPNVAGTLHLFVFLPSFQPGAHARPHTASCA